jgi:hypothetical protein
LSRATIISAGVAIPRGLCVEIDLGTLPADSGATKWAAVARMMAGKSYNGKTSPWWYDRPRIALCERRPSGARSDRQLRRMLGSKGGPERLTAAGAGMMAPVASNDTEEGRAKNRRVELVKRN